VSLNAPEMSKWVKLGYETGSRDTDIAFVSVPRPHSLAYAACSERILILFQRHRASTGHGALLRGFLNFVRTAI
jgi:hypothetical protein